MGIKKSKTIYTTDRGEEYYVEDMDNSHLANTITHIDKKIDALEKSRTRFFDSDSEHDAAIAGHIECLVNDQYILLTELANRESCKDEC